MKKIISLFLLVNICLDAYNQVIKGIIADNETRKPIYSAAVYINGTTVGTLSDADGNFKLDIMKFGSMPLSVSAIGYYSAILAEYSTSKPNLIYLIPRVFELNEVIVSDRSHARERKRNLTTFRNIFLGTTGNALNCEITNEEDIRFILSPDKDTLSAIAIGPIHIDNKSLGYKITYYLDEFHFKRSDSTFLFNGDIIFRDNIDLSEDIRAQIKYEKKRESAYSGSRMHFFRSLWFDDLDSAGFVIMNLAKDTLNYKDIVSQNDIHAKYLKYKDRLVIEYDPDRSASLLIFLKDSILFDPNGYFHPNGITWEGDMARQRIADWLPYEYSIK